MKKVLIPFMLFLCMNAIAQTKPAPAKKPAPKSAPPTPSPVVLKNQVDSLSYAIGVLDGTFFKTQGVNKVNGQMLGRGFSDVINGKPLCSPEVANEIVRREMQKMSQARVQPNIDQGTKFLEENRKKTGVKETASGLQYEVITMGSGLKPADTSIVKVHYDGFLLNGTIIDSSRDRGEPYTTPLTQVIRGWTEGLQLMPVGSRFKFYIPYTMGYGVQGSGASIPGGSLLIFDIELIEIVSNK
jgi:FKBP-type peptidyl-prolyl cis-trans isomerase